MQLRQVGGSATASSFGLGPWIRGLGSRFRVTVYRVKIERLSSSQHMDQGLFRFSVKSKVALNPKP